MVSQKKDACSLNQVAKDVMDACDEARFRSVSPFYDQLCNQALVYENSMDEYSSDASYKAIKNDEIALKHLITRAVCDPDEILRFSALVGNFGESNCEIKLDSCNRYNNELMEKRF